MQVDVVNEIIHQGTNTIMRWRKKGVDLDGTRTVFTGVDMKTGDSVEIEGLDKGLRKKSTLSLQGRVYHGLQEMKLPV